MTSRPVLLIGKVAHKRLRPVENRFVYPVFCMQLPLHDLDAAVNRVFSIDRPHLLSFRQRDHGPCDGSPLLPWIQAMLRQRGLPDDGEIILQCFPRVLGYVFNPVSFWFCRNRGGELMAVLAEVRNTFGGHYGYLLHNPDGAPLRDGQILQADKAFHVSPFCDVEGSYQFRFHLCAQETLVDIDYDDGNGDLLLTSISARHRDWSTINLLSALLRMPLLTFGVMARIHWQALRLWLKGVPFHGSKSPISPQEPLK